MNSPIVESIWHPYSSVTNPLPLLKVAGGEGCRIHLESGEKLIDAMSSWWSVIHGYNHPELNAAATQQINTLSHVMFGGLSHEPAEQLCDALLSIAPANLHSVFLCDTGSVSVEVAMKMAAQFWHGRGKPDKRRFISLRGGYHGDTRSAMSVSDPETGMHELFTGIIQTQSFLDRPPAGFDRAPDPEELQALERSIAAFASDAAAIIIEPIVQGAGGMYFYSPEYLKAIRDCCKRHELLLIADEIATGFGRTGKLFACEHAAVEPDILCIGKAMTGGYLTQAATLCTEEVAVGICSSEARVFMHGPTFMANPLACSVSLASLNILARNEWPKQIRSIEQNLMAGLERFQAHENVSDIRVLGAIGVIETRRPIDNARILPTLLEHGVWLRPFGKLLYTMPPYITSPEEVMRICSAMGAVLDID